MDLRERVLCGLEAVVLYEAGAGTDFFDVVGIVVGPEYREAGIDIGQ